MTGRTAEQSLAGKVALVTGAGRGIGAATARALAAHGAGLVLTSRTAAELEPLAAEIRATGGAAEAIAGDLVEPGFVERLFAETERRLGRLDILVNNAGTVGFGPIEDVAADTLRVMLELNTIAPYACMRAAVALMRRTAADGVVVNIGSTEAHWTAQGDSGVYPATKFALRALTLAVAKQMKADGTGIRICQVDPGGVDTTIQQLPPEAKPYLLAPEAVARSVVHVVTAPPGVHVLDTVVVAQPFATW
ncbi:SDR family oxidoreductase [Actinomadura viridis]|uniref:SDR family oxidoreductase n=1 Tax=Actinomadura viridis TaxID=58110 RepID=UPI0036A34BAB